MKDVGDIDGQQLKKKRGRPKKGSGDTRKNACSVRFDDEEKAMLNHLEIESDDNKSDIMRKALRTYYKIQARKGFK